MKKKLLIGGAVLVVVVALGVVLFLRHDSRSFFDTFAQQDVDDAVKALDAESGNAAAKCAFAEHILEEVEGDRPWVRQSEIDALRKQIEDAKARLRAKYPAKAAAWKMGEAYTWAVVTYQFKVWQLGERSEWYDRSANLALMLDIPLDLSDDPWAGQEKEPAGKQRFVREHLGGMSAAIKEKHGADAEKLFRLDSMGVLAVLAASQRDTFPDKSPGYPDEIARLAKETGLPENLWQPFIEALASKAPAETIADKLAALENGATEFLGVKKSAADEKK